MDDRLRQLMIAHGGLVFLGGLLVGFPFAFFMIGEISLWPIPWKIHVQLPGTERAWRMAHLEGLLNGLTLLAVAAIWDHLRLGERARKWVAWGLVVTAWGNLIASTLGPIFGGRGLAIGSGFEEHGANGIMFLLFVAAIVTVMIAMALVVRGAIGRR
jgi:hypothetical protein